MLWTEDEEYIIPWLCNLIYSERTVIHYAGR